MSNRVMLGIVVAVVALAAAAWVITNSDDPPSSASDEVVVAEDRLDIALVGDSYIEQSRDAFLQLAGQRELSTEALAFGGTALCDWIDRIRDLVARKPEHLILSFVGNDSTPCINPKYDPDAPRRRPLGVAAERYLQDLEAVLEAVGDDGPTIYITLPPAQQDPVVDRYARRMRDMYEEFATEHPEVVLVDTASALSPEGRFQTSLPCEEWEAQSCSADGTIVVRDDDGIHLTPAGGQRYARAMVDALRG